MKNLQQLIEDLKLNYASSDITDANFPDSKRGKVTKIFKFDSDFTLEEAIARLDKEGYRPATPYELLEWAKKNWNGEDSILALGQIWHSVDGHPYVVCLWSDDGYRKLFLGWTGHGWDSVVLVAGVRKSSKSLGSSDSLDSLNLRVLELEKTINKIRKFLILN